MAVTRSRGAKRAHRLASITKQMSNLLDVMAILDALDELEASDALDAEDTLEALEALEVLEVLEKLEKLDAPSNRSRSTLVVRERRPFATYIKPMLQDLTFSTRFRMDHDDFMILVDLLRPALQKNEKMGLLRNGAIPVEYQVAMTLRWLAGGSIYECMDGHVIARSTAYHVASTVISALNACPELNCKWPEVDDAARAAELFRNGSSLGIIRKCVGAMDGLFIRMVKPNAKDTAEPNSNYNGHKKGFGMNFQAISDAQYRIIAWTMNCPGSQNDRTAFNCSGFQKLVADLPEGHFIVGDAAYPASDRVVVPFPGTSLSDSQDTCNYYVSQCRMAIEQTFGILVRRWGILWHPMEVGLEKFVNVVNAVVRLHNFCRDRQVDVPKENVGSAVPPPEVSFDEDGLISSDYFETVPVRAGRPVKDQAKVSKPRETIRKELEVAGFARPEHNVARNRKRAS